ncbi:putative methyltransferase-domain-containing protein [Microdochium trichocladiopsis]|uniref:Methyltransferase-domain-containing protein n=1 Tax=Microdochium trichocladiopsis TaxID=1682393 RepID=A0A9P9BNG8_9PEZI|nr:putative methyltransferase-domain-containing protein [Microdochium trichocladiopsis]KAH7027728.1 putative methyltransferase-domain-containing protein [Microdochium trichocladiopsis]
MATSVLDFPQVWQRPSYDELLACFHSLRYEPPVWGPDTSRRNMISKHERSAQYQREVAGYLSSMIKSGFSWITDEEEQEVLWNEASRRISERCGRAGMGELVRRWPFVRETEESSFELIVREPPITGDALGLKTWASSYALAQLLGSIAQDSLAHLLALDKPNTRPKILELGSGTGLLGMAAAGQWRANVLLGDLPTIISNLSFNVDANRSTIDRLGGSLDQAALTWGGPLDDDDESKDDERFAHKNQFDIILAADAIYDDDHPELLAAAICEHLSTKPEARVVLMSPLRDSLTSVLLDRLRSTLAKSHLHLVCLEEHIVEAQDDWDEDRDTQQVKCWWAVFGQKTHPVGL